MEEPTSLSEPPAMSAPSPDVLHVRLKNVESDVHEIKTSFKEHTETLNEVKTEVTKIATAMPLLVGQSNERTANVQSSIDKYIWPIVTILVTAMFAGSVYFFHK